MGPSASAERKYALYDEFSVGGMASVHLGRVVGAAGFARTVAVKRLHAHFAKDPDFVAMFLDEARIAARVQHPNVVATLDVADIGGEVFLVMEYVHGESVSQLLRSARERRDAVPIDVAVSVLTGVLHGLHAAHEARSEAGEPLMIVHRDVSPQNILVGKDGVARVFDFGIAKAVGQHHATREGQLKGKLPYMAPEQLRAQTLDRRADVYAAGVVLWELLTGRRLFDADNEGAIVGQVLNMEVTPPGKVARGVPAALDEAVLTALSRDPARRFATARRMAMAVEAASPPAGAVKVGDWVEELASQALERRAARIARIEAGETPERVEGADAEASEPRFIEVTDTLPMARVRTMPFSHRKWPYALALTATSILGAGAWAASRSHAPSTVFEPSSVASASAATAPVVETPTSSAEAPLSATPPPAGPARAVATARPSRPWRPPRPQPTPPLNGTTKPPSSSCNPPYTWQAGVKVPKAECPLD
jgi:eukaryotic-like serine/threonine-protein kinase